MRDEPLVLVLDEPTTALDAESEHALFERYASGARETGANGRVTLPVSHRFSTRGLPLIPANVRAIRHVFVSLPRRQGWGLWLGEEDGVKA